MKKAFGTLIDITKAITAGLFIASVVSILIQDNEAGWLLFGGFVAGLFISIVFSILYERRYPDD